MNNYSTTPQARETIAALWRLEKIILDTLDFKEVAQKIADSVLSELGYLNLGYRIIVLTLVDEEKAVLKRISISQTIEARQALEASPIPFHDIEISLSAKNNACIQVLESQKPIITHSLVDVLCPPLMSEQVTPVQKEIGIKTTMVYPIISKGKSLGAIIFSLIKSEDEVSKEEKELLAGFTDVVGLAVQNSKLYTSLEETTEKLREANEKLKKVDELKDEFVSLASHELRTPMTAIKSYLWLVIQGKAGEMNEKQKLYLDRVYISNDRLIKLVNDMLNVSRIESGRLVVEKREVGYGKVVEDTITEIKPRADEQKINLALQLELEQSINVFIDPDKIKEVLINLIGNSLKFTPENGSITIKVIRKDNEVITSVTDTGKGIKQEDMPKLFKKFGMLGGNFLVKQSAQGTGLGLYISKSIIEIHGGKMWVESEGEGKGATFSFSLPTDGKDNSDVNKNIGESKSGEANSLPNKPLPH